MSKTSIDIMRREVNKQIREISSQGLKPPTQLAYRYKQFPQIYYQPNSSRFGQIRSFDSANKIALEKGYQTLTEEEYGLAITNISKIEELDIEALKSHNAELLLDRLGSTPLSEEQYNELYEKLSLMSNKEINEILKGEEGSDIYTNVDNWITQNILDMNGK